MHEDIDEIDEYTPGLPEFFKENTDDESASDSLVSHTVSNSNYFDPVSSSDNQSLIDVCEKNISEDPNDLSDDYIINVNDTLNFVHKMDAPGVEYYVK